MASTPPSPPRRLRACAPCTKVKAKCTFQPVNVSRHLCDRCLNSGLDCLAKTTQALRKPKRLRTDSDGAQGCDQAQTVNVVHEPLVQAPKARETSPTPQSLYGLTWTQATQALTRFRKEYTPNFPFVTIPSSVSAENLARENPFLFRSVILAAAPFPASKLSKVKRNVLAYLGYQMLVEEVRTLDLLQGVLVCIAWAHLCLIGDEQVTKLSYLALGYAHSLGITKSFKDSDTNVGESTIASADRANAVEESRAFLGLYCILSVISTKGLSQNPLDGKSIDRRCAALVATQASPTDLILERTVRFIQLDEQLTKGFGEPYDQDRARAYGFLLEGRGRGFRTDLNRLVELAADFDFADRQSTVQLHSQYLLARLYEPAIAVAGHPEGLVGPSMYRSLCLRNAFDAIKTFFQAFQSSPAEQILRRSLLTADQVGFVTLLAARLLRIDTPDWDVEHARETFHLSSVIDKVVEKITEAEALRTSAVKVSWGEPASQDKDERSALLHVARKMRRLKEWFETRSSGTELLDHTDGRGEETRKKTGFEGGPY